MIATVPLVKKGAEVLCFLSSVCCRKNTRQKRFILAPFREKLCAKSISFWRVFLSLFGAGFCGISACDFEKYAPCLLLYSEADNGKSL